MMWFQGPLICCALATPEALLVTQTPYFSQFFPRFFVGLHRICLCANVLHVILNIDICTLLVRIDCVALKHEWKLQFLRWKTCSSVLSLVPGTLEIAFRALKFKNFLGEHAPDPLRNRGLTAPCWYSQLLYSNLLATSTKIIIENPATSITKIMGINKMIIKGNKFWSFVKS